MTVRRLTVMIFVPDVLTVMIFVPDVLAPQQIRVVLANLAFSNKQNFESALLGDVLRTKIRCLTIFE